MAVEPRRYRAIVEYDGTAFRGYQIQAEGRTVQGEIEKALTELTGQFVRINGAGRTDAGVHAIGQVIAFDACWKHSLEKLHHALNAVTPRDIVVTALTPTSPTFHPRFAAISRAYRYRVVHGRVWPSVLDRYYAYHLRDTLDVDAMNEACHYLLGSQDFASFGKPTQGTVTIRNLMHAVWSVQDEHRLTFDIKANAFLYRMVRTIVGTLIQVGRGHRPPDDIKDILAARDLTCSAPPAPAHGLCLVAVEYPLDLEE